MVPPTMFVSGAIAVLHVCNEVYTRFRGVKRFREDCEKLAHFVHRIEAFITETEDDADMTGPGWEAAFSALHESLLEVVGVFDDCARYGMIRSMINADELNLRLNAISQRLTLSLQLIPIQKTKAMDKRLVELQSIQSEIRTAAFTAVRAAEEQSASLKRLMDQSRVDTNKTHEMLEQVLLLLSSDPCARGTSAAKAAAGPGPSSQGGGAPPQQQQGGQQDAAAVEAGIVYVDVSQLEAELADLHVELKLAVQNKNVTEEQYLEQVIAAISAMEAQLQQGAGRRRPDPPVDLRCPITCALLVDPVILVDSAQTYERTAIQEWLDRGNRKDPVTGVMLSSTVLVPNIAVRKMAEDWLVANGLPPSDRHLLQQQYSSGSSSSAAAAAAAPRGKPALQQQASASSDVSCFEKAAAQQLKCSKPGPAGDADNADDAFSINPKTAAILAAGASAGFSPFEDAVVKPQLSASLFPSSSSGKSCSQDADQREKQLAQQAYARAVAAAAAGSAAAGGTAVVAMAVGAAGSGGPFHSSNSSTLSGAAAGGMHADQRERHYSTASSITEVSSGSSITFGRDGSARTLPSFSHTLQQQRPDGRGSLDFTVSGPARLAPISDEPEASVQFCPWPSAAAAPAAAPAAAAAGQSGGVFQQQQSFHQPLPLAPGQAGSSAMQHAQQQQLQRQSANPRHPSPQQSSSPFADGGNQARFTAALSSMSMGNRSRQERAVAAAAAAAAMVAQQQQGSFRLQDLHGTLGRAAETRYRMSLRHSSPAAAEAVLSMQQQIQQERSQQQQQGQAVEEREYLQQHMERLMRSQTPERVRRFSASGSPSPSPGHQRPQQPDLGGHSTSMSAPLSSIPGPPSSSGGASPGGGATYVHFRQSADFAAPAALRESRSDSAGTGGNSTGSYRSAPVSAAGAPPPSAPASVDLCSTSVATSAPKPGSGLSVLSFARLRQQPVERQTSSQFDDRASVCSSSSSSSRRSVGKNLLGALKSLKYSMVYDDDKV